MGTEKVAFSIQKVTIESHTRFWLVPKSTTLN